MNLQFLESNGCVVCKVIGRLDVYGAEDLKARCHILIKEGRRSLVLDLSEVAYSDSAGIGALVTIDHWLSQHGRTLALYRPSPIVARLLEVMALDTVFDSVNDLELAPRDSAEKDAEWRSTQRVLLFSTRKENSRQVCELLRQEGFKNLQEAETATDALDVIGRNRVNLVVVDLAVPVESVLDFTDGLQGTNLNLPIVHAGFEVLAHAQDKVEAGADQRRSFLTLVMSGLLGEEFVFFDLLRYRLERKSPRAALDRG